jgi:transcriptional regulator with XRE-family HTH domain
MTKLSELVRAAADERGISARAIARMARDNGYSLNHDTAARYVRGDHGTPDEATLVALSEVLAIPLARLRAAADLPSESTAPYVPPAEASRLTRRQRRAVDEIIRAMLEPSGRARAKADEPPSELDARRSRRTGRAARRGKPEPPVD